MNNPSQELKAILFEIIERLQLSGGSGHIEEQPDFDYYALDYLSFAESNLEHYLLPQDSLQKDNELISCVSNLKRALDNQISCFLNSWGLLSEFNKKNIGLDKKLEFLTDSGLFNSRTIRRFSTLRNKVEHEFRRPEVSDLEAMYDLTVSLVIILQQSTGPNISNELDFEIFDIDFEVEKGSFSIEYNYEDHSFIARWSGECDGSVTTNLDSPSYFAYFLRVLLTLNYLESYGDVRHIRSKLDITNNEKDI